MRKEEELQGVTLLGNQGTKYVFEYSPDILEVFDNKHPDPPNEKKFVTICHYIPVYEKKLAIFCEFFKAGL